MCFDAIVEFQHITPFVAQHGALSNGDGLLLYNGNILELHGFCMVHLVSINVL